MKNFTRLICLCAILVAPITSFAAMITGDVTGGGNFAGSVTSSNAWIGSNATDGDAVNFWTFTANAGDVFSASVLSTNIEFGLSLYSGLVDQGELLFAGFNNAGDFGDNLFVAGTNPFIGAIGTSLSSILLPYSGVYTLAVGGEHGLSFDGNFAYNLNVGIAPAVPLPAAAWLLMSGLLSLGIFRRKK